MYIEKDYLGKDGCCLICAERGNCNDPCPQCRCTKCSYYKDYNGRHPEKDQPRCMVTRVLKGSKRIEIADVVNATEKAYLLNPKDKNYTESWFPSSEITVNTHKDGKITADIPYWLLEENEWLPGLGWDKLGGLTISEVEFRLNGKEFYPRRFR